MPTSDPHNIAAIVSVIRGLRPRSLLDVGCGFGKYGVLAREYLDVWDERITREQWQTRIVGIEAFAAYRNPIWDYAYDAVHIGRAQDLLPTLPQFDVILIADVIEHLEMDDALQLVGTALDRGSTVLISTPVEFYPQEDLCDNDFERHRILWTANDFPGRADVATIPGLACNIFVASRSPLDRTALYPASASDVLYLRSRHKLRSLGKSAWPVAAAVRAVNRLLST